MGLDLRIRTGDESRAEWPVIRSLLERVGEKPQLRMIDGELALPDDDVPSEWQELRILLSSGIVTLRRIPDGISTIVWGNADAKLLRSRDILAWAVASSCGGMIESNGLQSADAFALSAKLWPA